MKNMKKILGLMLVSISCANTYVFAYKQEDLDKARSYSRSSLSIEEKNKKWSLQKADLIGATLRWATLTGATLNHARLFGADLTGATLTGATLNYASLIGADLKGADLYEANLSKVMLSGANLGWVKFNDKTIVEKTDFGGAKNMSEEFKIFARSHGALNVPE